MGFFVESIEMQLFIGVWNLTEFFFNIKLLIFVVKGTDHIFHIGHWNEFEIKYFKNSRLSAWVVLKN